jgi:hypothetical protein
LVLVSLNLWAYNWSKANNTHQGWASQHSCCAFGYLVPGHHTVACRPMTVADCGLCRARHSTTAIYCCCFRAGMV